MAKLLGWLGAFVGSAFGWWGGAHAGIMTAFVLSTIGTGVGLYAGRWVALHYFG